MTSEKNYIKNIKPYSNNYISFGDGSRGKIVGKCQLDYLALPYHDDVLLVNGLTANLISISQLCDQ